MSVFWEYFKKTLRFPLIWSDGYLSLLVKGGAMVLDQAREDILEFRRQAMPESCDSQYLDHIAASRGVTRWENEPDDFWRRRVGRAMDFNCKAGKRVGVQEILEMAGVESEIWEPADVSKALLAAGVLRLDGSWKLDGAQKLESVMALAGMPYLGWAEFGIRINFANYTQTGQEAFLKHLIYEYKPARSLPKFLYYLSMIVDARASSASSLYMHKQVDIPYPRLTPKLDGTWKLGVDPRLIRLGELPLDGTWQLGESWPGEPGVRLEQLDIVGHLGLRKVVELPREYQYARLGERFLRLDGSWKVGLNGIMLLTEAALTKEIEIESPGGVDAGSASSFVIPYPAAPAKLGRNRTLDGLLRLDGSWKLGSTVGGWRLDGTKKLITPGWPEPETALGIVKTAECGRYPRLAQAEYKLGDSWARRLDGSWKLGAYNRLDSTWRLDGTRYLTAPRLKRYYKKLDGSWKLGYDRKLDGSWVLGHMGPQAEAFISIGRS